MIPAMVSSKFAAKPLEQKTPPHCRPCPPPGPPPSPPHSALLYGRWEAILPFPLPPFAELFDGLPLTTMIPGRWWKYHSRPGPYELFADINWQPNPGSNYIAAWIIPDGSFARHATSIHPAAPPEPDFWPIHFLMVPEHPDDVVTFYVSFTP